MLKLLLKGAWGTGERRRTANYICCWFLNLSLHQRPIFIVSECLLAFTAVLRLMGVHQQTHLGVGRTTTWAYGYSFDQSVTLNCTVVQQWSVAWGWRSAHRGLQNWANPAATETESASWTSQTSHVSEVNGLQVKCKNWARGFFPAKIVASGYFIIIVQRQNVW